MQAKLLMDIKPELDHLGVSLVAVGVGTRIFAKKFQIGLPFEGSVFVDEVGRLLLLCVSHLKCVVYRKGYLSRK